MTTSGGSTVNMSNNGRMGRSGSGRSCGGNWTGLNIATMVVSFVFFGPLGLFVLAWILMGRDVREIPGAAKNLWRSMTGNANAFTGSSNNVVFDDFQQTQYDRINEIKHEIKNRADRFKAFRDDVKRRQDKEEFDRFMADTPNNGG